jgi:Rieske Fe-S protein
MNNKDNPPDSSRRNFLTKLFMGGGLLGSSVLLIKYGINYIFPSMEEPPLRKLLVGRVDEIKTGEAKEFQVGEESLFLIKTEEGYKVFSSVCTHLGCKISWEAHRNRFYCPCHKGIFDAKGNVVEGPPPRPLDGYKVEVDKNLVYMWIADKSRRIV